MLDATGSKKSSLLLLDEIVLRLKPTIETRLKLMFEQILIRLDAMEARRLAMEASESDGTAHSRVVEHLENQVSVLEERLDAAEQYSHRQQLVYDGVPEGDNDDTDAAVLHQCQKLNLKVSLSDLQRTHRLGARSGPDKPRPIIAQFLSYRTKAAVVKAAKADLFSSLAIARKENHPSKGILPRIPIREHLTKKRASMLRDIVRLVQSVWTEDGCIIA